MKELELPIYFYKDGQQDLEKIIDKTSPLVESDIKNMVFYHIANISPYSEDGCDYTCISSGGVDFYCPYSIRDVRQMIKEAFG